MIDRDIIESLDPDMAKAVKSAIGLLADSGILQYQLNRMFQRLSEGDIDEEVADLADKIKDYRFKAAGLRALQQFGESILKEYRDHA